MLENLKMTVEMWYADFMFKYGPERLELARLRLAAHDVAMKEGHNSPYTHPDDYSNNWVLKTKLK